MGAWAEQRHTWALHAKITGVILGAVSPPKGVVAPYPEFFSGLATLTRRTAAAFQAAGLERHFDVKTVAVNLLELLTLRHGTFQYDPKDFEALSTKLAQLEQFQLRYSAYRHLDEQLEAMARRCAATGETNQTETETLRAFFECREDVLRMLQDFAPVCERLAELAEKSLTGRVLTDADAQWIHGYGITLAGFHLYYANTYESPRDDFPIVTRVFSHPASGTMLYAGLARPQSIYIILPDGKSNQLYRGAVLSYREFVRPNDQLLDDQSWRELIHNGQTPPAPPFTRSFCAETNVSNPK